MKSGISIIVCCYNSAARIPATLKHLSLQHTAPNLDWEIILVDNASTDNTQQTAKEAWEKLGTNVDFKIVEQPKKGLANAREMGVEKAKYDVLIFCDDDNWFEKDYVQNAFTIMKSNEQIGALGGNGIAISDEPLPAWFEKNKFCYASFPQADKEGDLIDPVSTLYGAGLVVSREALELLSNKKFKPLLTDRVGSMLTSGGDTELCYAIRLVGYKLWYSETLKFSHYLPSSRLSEAYLCKLVSAMSYCSGMLIIYGYVLNEKHINGFTWLKDATYQVFFLIGSVLKYLFGRASLLEKKLNLAFSCSRVQSVFHQLGYYRFRYQQVLQLKK